MVHFGKRFAKPGTAPGTLSAPEVRRVEHVSISVMEYDAERVEEWHAASLDEALARREGRGVTWIDVIGLNDVDLIRQLGEVFGLHPLALEDVLNTGQRPKVEVFDDHLFVVLRLLHAGPEVESEQISMFVGEGFLLTIQEIPRDVFDGVRDRIRHGLGRIRRSGSDYLAYAVIDSVVDNFFPVLEELGSRLEDL